MIKLDQFQMHDTFMTPRHVMLGYAMDAAKRHAEMMRYQVRCVAIVSVEYQKPVALELFGNKGKEEIVDVYTIDLWGHEIEVPDEFKHWTERLTNNAHLLTTGDAWDGL